MKVAPNVRGNQLVIAALLAGAAGLALVALGWWVVDWQPRYDWERLSDSNWWTSVVVRGLGLLSFSGIGFKIALACVVGVGGAFAWLRGRRRREAEEARLASGEGRDDADAVSDKVSGPQ